MMNGDYILLICFILFIITAGINIYIFFFMKQEQSLYFSLFKIISLVEVAFLFSKLILLGNNSPASIQNKFRERKRQG